MKSELKIKPDGRKEWHKHGKLHREKGPAVIYPNGTKYWFINGKLHQENGPAIIYSDGSKIWFINGKCHRENGPASIHPDGSKFWYINGQLIKVLFENKEYKADYDPCEICLVKVMCNQLCRLKQLLNWSKKWKVN